MSSGTNGDRIHQLEQQVDQLNGQIAGLIPVRMAPGGGGGGGGAPASFRCARVTTPAGIPRSKIVDGGFIAGTGKVRLVNSQQQMTGGELDVTNIDSWEYQFNARVWLDGLRVNHGNCFPDEWPADFDADD